MVALAPPPVSPVTGRASAAAASLAVELGRVQEALARVATGQALVKALAGTVPIPVMDRARTILRDATELPGIPVNSVELVDDDGRVRVSSTAGATPTTAAGSDTGVVARALAMSSGAAAALDGPADAQVVLLAMPVGAPGDARPDGVLLAELPLGPLVEEAFDGSRVPEGLSIASVTLGDPPGSRWSVVAVEPDAPLPPGEPVVSLPLVGLLAGLAVAALPLAWAVGRTAPRRRGAEHQDPLPVLLVDPAPEPRPAPRTPPEELQDVLTGLGNHRAYLEEMDRLMDGYERNRVPFALLLLDVDDLGVANQTAGHAAGDEILRAIGRGVRTMLRYSDRGFRVGGDEFAILLPHTDAAGAAHLAERLRIRLGTGSATEPTLAFSAGASDLPNIAQAKGQLMEQAAAALAWCKAHGRASVSVFDPTRDTTDSDRDRAGRDVALAQVVRERLLRPVFQPIVDMQSGEVVGYEGLIRPTPASPFANPASMFEAAHLADRVVELDLACFSTIAAGAAAIPEDRVVSINLSPRTVEAPDFSAAGMLAILAQHRIDPGRVIMELTEHEDVLDKERLRSNLAELQRTGVRIAADDVGAGNAGLRLLSQIRFDIVKIDLSLVQDGATRDTSDAVLRSIKDLAERWGAFVIAEGIETPAQLTMVRQLGLGAGQGYLLGRPGPIVDLPPLDLAGLEAGELMLQNAPLAMGGMGRMGVAPAG
jgi:diguanylate cyclase (GGDEF)-like protein